MSGTRYGIYGDDRSVYSPPSGCGWCGIGRLSHGQRWHSEHGWHRWEPPTQRQILTRMMLRRGAPWRWR